MKKLGTTIIVSSIFYTLISCSPLKMRQQHKDITGVFYNNESKNGFNYDYTLHLNQDNSFSLSHKIQDANPQCIGRWERKGDSVFLKCNEEKDAAVILSSGYMNQREYTITILNKNKLKLDKVILKRKWPKKKINTKAG